MCRSVEHQYSKNNLEIMVLHADENLIKKKTNKTISKIPIPHEKCCLNIKEQI